MAWAALGVVALAIAFSILFAGKASAQFAVPGQDNAPVEPLAILSTPAPLPLGCVDGQCAVFLSSIALDEASQSAEAGQTYVLAEGSESAIMIGGQPLSAIPDARIEASGHYSSVRLVLPESSLAVTGLPQGRARVTVTRPVAAEAMQLEKAPGEGVRLTGAPLPELPGQFDFPSALSVLSIQASDSRVETIAGQLIARTLAELPAENISGLQADRHWQAVRSEAAADHIPTRALTMADGAFARCYLAGKNGSMPVGDCLWSHHNGFLSVLNRAYWRAAVPGA